jgi:hypothetical protein
LWQGKRRHPLLNRSPHFRVIDQPDQIFDFHQLVRQLAEFYDLNATATVPGLRLRVVR